MTNVGTLPTAIVADAASVYFAAELSTAKSIRKKAFAGTTWMPIYTRDDLSLIYDVAVDSDGLHRIEWWRPAGSGAPQGKVWGRRRWHESDGAGERLFDLRTRRRERYVCVLHPSDGRELARRHVSAHHAAPSKIHPAPLGCISLELLNVHPRSPHRAPRSNRPDRLLGVSSSTSPLTSRSFVGTEPFA